MSVCYVYIPACYTYNISNSQDNFDGQETVQSSTFQN